MGVRLCFVFFKCKNRAELKHHRGSFNYSVHGERPCGFMSVPSTSSDSSNGFEIFKDKTCPPCIDNFKQAC